MIFLLFSGWLFWLVLIIAFIIATVFVENDSSDSPVLGPTITFIIFLVICYLSNRSLSEAYVISWSRNPGPLLVGILIYVGVGIAWSFVKWLFLLIDYKNDVSKQKYTYPSNHYHESAYKILLIPKASDNKSAIIAWMVYWPCSVFWTCLNKPFVAIYNVLASSYDRLAKYILGDLTEVNLDKKD